MSGFTSLSQIANSAVNKSKSQERIIAREIETDGPTAWKLAKLAKVEKQTEKASNYFTQAMKQDTENAKLFMDSVKETLDKIDEETKKREEEEKVAENAEETFANNGIDEGGENKEPGAIVDVVIPATVVSSDLPSDKTKDEQTDASVDVSA